jgi:hypothetical protein
MEERIAANRARQQALYGAPLDRAVHGIVRALGITQATLAATLGMSPAMLSQLASARRVKIGDPTVLARFALLVERCAEPVPPDEVPAVLAEARAAGWSGRPEHTIRLADDAPSAGGAPTVCRGCGNPTKPGPTRAPGAADPLRGASPGQLVAAAAALAGHFPEVAELLRRAAATRP